nr:MAG TPA: hypothetical protein [Bacteriophage sp.]DAF25740.1 MAG TPA: hypothetical protein [Caudoviricetes sp.]DAJ69656.1 MAG TPA: hypothetical protein [Caudoviricetes sp.]DAQ69164.1 MAG TPA: hypothetical protein [Caudoviricetes sp.]DAW00224.1 MAG TPA: hypothetical protein [Caudoviricetes sp.]
MAIFYFIAEIIIKEGSGYNESTPSHTASSAKLTIGYFRLLNASRILVM